MNQKAGEQRVARTTFCVLKALTQGSQSTKKMQAGSAYIAAWMSAHVSVAGMSSIHSGGSPDAAAMTSPPSLMATKAHPFQASSWEGPSSLEPSV